MMCRTVNWPRQTGNPFACETFHNELKMWEFVQTTHTVNM